MRSLISACFSLAWKRIQELHAQSHGHTHGHILDVGIANTNQLTARVRVRDMWGWQGAKTNQPRIYPMGRSEGKDESKFYLELVSLQNVEDLVGGTAKNIVGLAPQVVCDKVEQQLVRPLRLPRLRPVPQTDVGVLARGRLGWRVISERNSRVPCAVTAVAGGTCGDGMWICMLA